MKLPKGEQYYRCLAHGFFVSLKVIEKIIPFKDRVQALQQLLSKFIDRQVFTDIADRYRCPRCIRMMKVGQLAMPTNIEVDVCPRCQSFWFDEKELQAVSSISGELRQAQEKLSFPSRDPHSILGESRSVFSSLTDLPVEMSAKPVQKFPIMTFLILISLIYIGLKNHRDGFELMRLFSFGYLLYIFGDNVEDNLGHFRFFVMFLVCALVGSIAQHLALGSSEILRLDLYGALLGMVFYYVLAFPQNKISLFPYFQRGVLFIGYVVFVPAYVFLVFLLIFLGYRAMFLGAIDSFVVMTISQLSVALLFFALSRSNRE